MQARADRAFGGVERAGNFAMRHALKVEHRHDAAVGIGEFFEGFVESCAEFADDRLAFRIDAVAGVDECRIAAVVGNNFVKADARAAVSFAQEIERVVYGDLVDPGVEARVAAKAADRAECARIDFLQDVVTVLVVRGHVVDKAVEAGLVLFDE